MTTTPTREQEIQDVLKQYPLTYFIAAAALFIVIGILIGAALFGQAEHATDYFSNVYLTIISTAFTVIVIDRLNRRRDEQRGVRELKVQLLRDVRSIAPGVAINAVHQLQERDWLQGENGLLKGAFLGGKNLSHAQLGFADLNGADLGFADLRGTELFRTNLSDADLIKANLKGANLRETNMSGASLLGADLSNTKLWCANLKGAYLWGVNLSRADLREANLSGAFLADADLYCAKLKDVTLNEETILPDDTTWTSDTDMTRFTDPQHTNFWRSDNPDSPAYRGKDTPK